MTETVARVRVGVSYRSDPEVVLATLERAARSVSRIVQDPPPTVAFTDFGPNALEFEIVADCRPAERIGAETALRIAILREVRAAGIELPFAQIDVHLRDLDIVRSALAQVARERARRDS